MNGNCDILGLRYLRSILRFLVQACFGVFVFLKYFVGLLQVELLYRFLLVRGILDLGYPGNSLV